MVIISLALAIFGYWGLNTQAGYLAFTGMAGLIPFYALVAALIILILTGISFVVVVLIKKSNA